MFGEIISDDMSHLLTYVGYSQPREVPSGSGAEDYVGSSPIEVRREDGTGRCSTKGRLVRPCEYAFKFG